MKTKGELKDIGFDMDRNLRITLTIDADPASVEKLNGKELSVELKPYREHRSLDANAYYWSLCSQIADAINQTVNFTHNVLLRRYGQNMSVNGELIYLVLPDTDEAERLADEAETYHIRPTSQVQPGKDGLMYRTYILLKGSHEYDTKEMSQLIDGTIAEAKQLGIDTMTETEKREMMERYGKKYSD